MILSRSHCKKRVELILQRRTHPGKNIFLNSRALNRSCNSLLKKRKYHSQLFHRNFNIIKKLYNELFLSHKKKVINEWLRFLCTFNTLNKFDEYFSNISFKIKNILLKKFLELLG